MNQEENVYEETTRTEQTMAVGEEEKGSTVPSKFKDVDALVRAYESLQAEFTRRSQKLRELEKTMENISSEGVHGARLGAEKLRKSARVRKAESKQFDQFIEETMKINVQDVSTGHESAIQALSDNEKDEIPEFFSNEPSEKLVLDGSESLDENKKKLPNEDTVSAMNEDLAKEASARNGEEEGAQLRKEEDEERVRESAYTDGNALFDSARLYELANQDEQVRLKIIGEYLSTIGKSGAPLVSGGVGVLATPPKKAKSILEAGDMALLYFKKPMA